jgi:cyclopropane fatty-acyl-phospholipid synthase-like methyltransferase
MTQIEKPPLDPHPLSSYVAWAGERNRDPILELFKERFPKSEGNVLEFASGSGMHIHYFAPHFQHLSFQPSDMNEEVFENIKQLTKNTQVKNVKPPIKLDLTQPQTWSTLMGKKFDAIFCINIFQVAPISLADGMMNCAVNYLSDRGSLFIYGPFKVDGSYTTPSNEEFDTTLLSYKVPTWRLKDIVDINKAAQKYGLTLKEKVDMPSHNFTLIYSLR